MADDNKWPLSRKIAAILFAAMIIYVLHDFFIGQEDFKEKFLRSMRLGLPAWVLYFVYQHQRVKKKRQAEQEADTRKAFLEKHDVKSSE